MCSFYRQSNNVRVVEELCVCACVRGAKVTRFLRSKATSRGEGRPRAAVMKWSRLIITFFRAIGFLLFFFVKLRGEGEEEEKSAKSAQCEGDQRTEKNGLKMLHLTKKQTKKKRIFPRIAAARRAPGSSSPEDNPVYSKRNGIFFVS